ncbi:MAG: Rne/Rng family ribonuclease [Bacteroidales bacterium]|nr:Rne/Rng family ribonuclease [Bacteroidales bacterium]
MESQKDELQNELYLDVRNSEISIALLHNKKLIELSRERANIEFSVGDIYLGKVKRLMPGLNAAFIDIGYKKDAFLHYLDLGAGFQTLNKFLHIAISKKQKIVSTAKVIPEHEIDKNGKITDILTVGQFVLVQIAKEPISSKGPRLTCEISLAGRNLVLMPFTSKVSVSQKIKSLEERTRLKKLIESITPENFGVIVRTVAEKKMVAELDRELNSLLEKWENLFTILPSLKPPILVIGEVNRTTAILRDILNSSFNQIVVNDSTAFEEIRNFITEIAPEKKKIVKLYSDKDPIFDHFGIEKQIKTAFGKTVPMRNGAYLIVEHTEAAHVIDVNSGNRSNSEQDQEENAFEVNMIAAEEIARQLRLRDMGGIIIVDFIDIHDESNKKKLFEKVKECMEGDRAKYHITSLSKFCLMEITRQRVRPEMEIKTSESCPCCKGSGKIAASINLTDEIENALKFTIKKKQLSRVIIKTHPFVSAYLNDGVFKSVRKSWQKTHNCKIKVVPMMSYTYMEYHFFDSNDEELIY